MAVGTTRGKRRLGRYVAPIVKRSGLKPDEIAKEVRCARQSVYRLLSGESLPRLHLLVAILGAVGANKAERDRALELWEVADSDTTGIEHADDLPVGYMRFRMDEAEAIRERTLDMVIIPGMLQTPEYATELSRGARRLIRTDGWEDRAAAERRNRQELLWRKDNPLALHSLIDEAALRRTIGDSEVMANQLDYLLEAGELPNVTIQVMPLDFGAHGAYSGALTLLNYPEVDESCSGYVESIAGGETLEDGADVAALSDVWTAIADAAPSAEKSTEIIRRVRDSVKKR
jgi:transcriptional regulator with XRE-family HTH domain